MCKITDMFYQEGIEKGIEKGKEIGLAQGKEIGLEQGKEIGLVQGKEIGLVQGKEIGLVQGKEIGLEQGEQKKQHDIAKKMISKGDIPLEAIMEYTDLPLDTLEKIQKEILATV